MKILHFDEIDSTNVYAKAHRGEGEDMVIVTRRQTGGMGTKGRAFVSGEGGVYLTRLTFYRDFPAAEAFRVMAYASVAVCRTLESFSLSPKIKWPNDVFVNDRKICGILIENTFSGGNLTSSIVGIGLNVNNRFSGELKQIAISAAEALGHTADRALAEERLIEETGKNFPMEEYLSRVGYLDREVTLIINGERSSARAISVDERGNLLARRGGRIEKISAGEVSLRLN